MSQSFVVAVLLLTGFVLANVPFVSQKLFGIFTIQGGKSGWLRVIEFIAAYFIAGGLGLFLENRTGQITSQNWEFYAINLALFVTFAFPGFIYRYLLNPSGK